MAKKPGCSTVVLIGITCPAITVTTAIPKKLEYNDALSLFLFFCVCQRVGCGTAACPRRTIRQGYVGGSRSTTGGWGGL